MWQAQHAARQKPEAVGRETFVRLTRHTNFGEATYTYAGHTDGRMFPKWLTGMYTSQYDHAEFVATSFMFALVLFDVGIQIHPVGS